MNKAEQRAAAKELYMLGWEQGRIARLVDVTEASVSAWVRKGDDGITWKEERAKKFKLESSVSNDLLELIEYQLVAIRSKVAAWKEESKISGKPLPLIGNGEIDALTKMFSSIKQKDISFTHYVNVCKELSDYVNTKDLELAQRLMEFIDGFVMQKRELLTK